MEAEIALLDIGELPMQAPVVLLGARGGDRFHPTGIGRGRVDLPVERQPHTVQGHGRFGTHAGGKSCAGGFEPVVEVFKSRGPMRSKGELDTGSHRPARAKMQALVLGLALARALNESPQRPGKTARSIYQPSIGCITKPAARAAEKVEPLGNPAAGGIARRDQVILVEEIRK